MDQDHGLSLTGGSPAARARAVYRPRAAGVKQTNAPAGLATLVVCAALAGAPLYGALGCATPLAIAPRLVVIAVRYDVEPVFVAYGERAALEAMRDDFDTMARLGFTAVDLRHVAPADEREIAELARARGISVLHLDPNRGRRRSPGPGRRTASAEPVRIYTDDARASSEVSGVTGSVGAFHAGLREGRTGGVVVDRFRRPMGDPRGLANATGTIRPARTAAVKTLIARARRWSPRLHGLRAARLEDFGSRAGTSEASLFTAGCRGHGTRHRVSAPADHDFR